MHDDFECFAGIDWATEAHQVCLVDRAGVILGERSFAPSRLRAAPGRISLPVPFISLFDSVIR